MLFSILGADNVSLSAGVVELLFVENKQWKLTFRGVLSLVKDYQNRAYFLRLYDILSGRKLWDFRLYKGFRAVGYGNCPYLLTFEDESRRQSYGLNFSSVEEAQDFKGHLDKRHEQESKPCTTIYFYDHVCGCFLAAAKNPLAPPNAPFCMSSSTASSIPLTSVSSGVTPVGTMVHAEKVFSTGSSNSFFSRKEKKKKEKRPRIRKEDISNPTNFQHKAHVGWDQDNGFSNNMCDSEPMDESIQNIIRAAGQDPTSMSKKTIKFVYDFIENYKDSDGLITVQSYKPSTPNLPPQWSSPVPPPPPSRTASHHPSAPPTRPPPPPPAVTSSSRPFEIQAGKQLRSVASHGVAEKSSSSDIRGDVMAQIRQGPQLKHVNTSEEEEKRRSGSGLTEMGGIADALAKALEERRMNMALDDSSDEEVSDERNEWSD
ncbi:unnamed protein product [Angiostrongylus costaricensis]|uniref:Neural Wiskott-Aldrich syndrome protein-like n=1 Tax=Angiostrongylus costaricensis TaxID=334426 RepID=A0A0R3PYW5_ANGCS|nr:unnamed protein product [Angiostrongylus costaricensis]